jgi:hypothetical protein
VKLKQIAASIKIFGAKSVNVVYLGDNGQVVIHFTAYVLAGINLLTVLMLSSTCV